ncbi:MAG: VCBS repeat-containing protein [Proteobacteria bacterium]|nr:VCBS repeat-containing protein [Pseudomonadota bacterium]
MSICIRTITYTLIIVCFMGLPLPVMASEPPSILVMPFRVVSSDKPDLVQSGVQAFLSSRLASDTCSLMTTPSASTIPMDVASPSPEEALAITQKRDANFLIYGTVVKFGQTLTTDAFLFDRDANKTRLHFHDLGTGDEALLGHLTVFSEQVASLLCAPCYPKSRPMDTPPEKENNRLGLSSGSLWKSPPINDEIIGMATGDLDGDQAQDLVLAHKDAISIWAMAPKALTPQARFQIPGDDSVVGVDVADVNKDGHCEIFVSLIQRDHKSINSLILEWDGHVFKTIQSGLKWVFRSLIFPGESSPGIVSQKNKNLSSLLGSPLCRFDYSADNYSPGPPMSTPAEAINLFSFTLSRDTMDTSYAMYAFNNRLRVYDGTLNLLWESEEPMGGGTSFMSMTDPMDRDKTNRLYIEPRLLFCDLDKDGVNELITVKNQELTNHLFSGMKNYTKGQIIVFKRTGLGYSSLFETEKVTGFITDFSQVDTDGDEHPELVYSVINRGKNLFSKKTSYVVIQTWARK